MSTLSCVERIWYRDKVLGPPNSSGRRLGLRQGSKGSSQNCNSNLDIRVPGCKWPEDALAWHPWPQSKTYLLEQAPMSRSCSTLFRV